MAFMNDQVSLANPQPFSGFDFPERVYSNVSRSGEIDNPKCSNHLQYFPASSVFGD